MLFRPTTRHAIIALGLPAILLLYLSGLSTMGLVSKDEPRYAAIGLEMATSGDWITPRLWGEGWFEKPPLLYWLVSLGFRSGLGPEVAPRLPVALLSVGFLIFFWRKLRVLFGERAANCATAIVATSGGWLAFSEVAVTDIPLAVTFSMAVLLALEGRRTAAAAALGFAVLAKSLVPLVLFVPVLALDRRNWRLWLRMPTLIAFLSVALPWHVLCALRNGTPFLWTLFVQQQFGRFVSGERQHVQPWWFYFPVLMLLLFPWFPLLVPAARAALANVRNDSRLLALLSVVVFGFLFFSASVNKLPSYLLPLLPCVCALMGYAVSRSGSTRWALLSVWAALGTLWWVARILPDALSHGSRYALAQAGSAAPLLLIPLAALPLLFIRRWPFALTVGVAACSLFALKVAVLPQVDTAASAREVWRKTHPACTDSRVDRGMLYGLNYYAGRKLPECVEPR